MIFAFVVQIRKKYRNNLLGYHAFITIGGAKRRYGAGVIIVKAVT